MLAFKFLFFSKILFIIFPDFNKKQLTQLTAGLFARVYVMKRGLFGVVTYVLTKNMTAKVAKPIHLTNGRKNREGWLACDRISFLFLECQ